MQLLARIFLIAAWLGGISRALAHDPGLSTAGVTLYTNHIEVVLGFAIADAAQIIDLDKNHDGRFSREELANGAMRLKSEATNALEITLDGQPASMTAARCEFDGNDNAAISLIFSGRSFTNPVIRSKWLALLQPGHRQLLTLKTDSGQVLAERLLSANDDHITVEVDPAAAAAAPRSQSLHDFLVMGVKHIWTGYDHLLFLFGLLIVTCNFGSAIKVITCFTLAHSITLAVATLNVVNIPSRFVEPLIAVSIVYVGIENLVRADDPKGRGYLAFGFGLIHGFGFASVLRELGVGVNGAGIAVPLVSFNLGVEIGQLVIAALLLPLIWRVRSHPLFIKRWVPACSTVVALLGAFWFVQRVWF
jgi:hydrogenase/urease accessory protein HupE